MTTKELVEKLVMGGIGLSLSVNAWLVKDRVTDMTTALEKVVDRLSDVAIKEAVLEKQVESNQARIDRHGPAILELQQQVAGMRGSRRGKDD